MLVPVTAGRSYYNSLNQLVVEIENTSPTDISHCFEHGKPLCFFTVGNGNEIKYFNHQSVVSYVDGNRMVATISGNQALIDIQNAEPLGVQLFFDETSYRTMPRKTDWQNCATLFQDSSSRRNSVSIPSPSLGSTRHKRQL